MDDSKVSDCHLSKNDVQFLDNQQDWVTEVFDYGSRRNKLITARRALDTSDLDDFMFQLDKEMVLAYSFSIETS